MATKAKLDPAFSIVEALDKAKNADYAAFQDTFKFPKTGRVDAYAHNLKNVAPHEGLHKTSELHRKIDELEGHADAHKSSNLAEDNHVQKRLNKAKVEAGIAAQKEADRIEKHLNKTREAVGEQFAKKHKEIYDEYAGSKKTTKDLERFKEQTDLLKEEQAHLNEKIKSAETMLGEKRAKIHEISGVASEGKNIAAATSAGKEGSTVIKNLEGKRNALGKTAEAAEKAWGEKKWYWGRPKEAIAQNFSHNGAGKKIMRVAGAGLGGIVIFAGLKDLGRYVGMVEPKKDAEGKDIPNGFGTLVKSAAEIGGGTAFAVFSLAVGGKNKALGKY